MLGLQILDDTHFISLIACSAILIFAISLSGRLHADMEKAVFGFFGLAWMVMASLAFLLYGAVIGFFHVAASYFFGLLIDPIASVIAGFIRGGFALRQDRPRSRNRQEPLE